MQKYGFKEGQGLGKHEQGLSTALSVEKTSKRGGKIIIGDSAEKGSTQLLVPAPGVGPGDTCTVGQPPTVLVLHLKGGGGGGRGQYISICSITKVHLSLCYVPVRSKVFTHC